MHKLYEKEQIILNVVYVQTMECVVITLCPLWSFGRRLDGLEIVAKHGLMVKLENCGCIDLFWFISFVKEDRSQSQNPYTEWKISSNTSGYTLKGLR